MTQDEIIRMAREAGIETLHIKRDGEKHSILDLCYPELERFAALVAAHWQKIHEQEMSMMSELCADRILEEREACAKVCEPVEGSAYEVGVYKTMQTLAAAIRARGEK